MSDTDTATQPTKSVVPWTDLLFLGLKLVVFALLLSVFFGLIFGVCRCTDASMNPACKAGDLIFYYRHPNTYHPSDLIVVQQNNTLQIRRILAGEGDVVNLTAQGLEINGYVQPEPELHTDTQPATGGISFPITLRPGEYFVLGDNRPQAKDSRIYGPVSHSQIKGTVITLLRRNGF